MKKVPFKKIVVLVTLGLILFMSKGMAQVEKGVTSTGKEVDCSTIDPSVDKAVNEYGAIVTHPRVTRNGKLITGDCFCPFDLVGITDTVYCSSVKMFSELSYLDSRILPVDPKILVYTDAERTNCVGTITATLIEHADGKDTVTANITGLNCYTRYYFRLVATNSTECAFDWTDSTRDLSTDTVTTCSVWTTNSNEHSPAAGRIDSVYDHQGNSYTVVQIGNQCWLRENMRATTSPSSGSTILVKSDFVKSRSSKCATYYEYDSTRYAKFGVLYNWCAAVDTFYNNGEVSHPELASDVNHVSTNWNVTLTNPRRGICPEGWHIPSNAEWNTLADSAGLTNNHFTGKLATGCDWLPSGSGPTNPKAGNYEYSERNSSAFSALPAGSFYADDFAGFGEQPYFWSTQTFMNERAYARSFLHDIDSLYRQDKYRNNAFSVRCLRDNFNPSVTLCGDCEEGSIFIKAVANVDSCALLSSTKSFVASKKNPAVDDKFAGLDPGKYYVVSISSTGNTVTDSVTLTGKVHVPCVGTAHTGTEISTGVYANKEWGSAAGIIDSVSDHQGNVYEVVQIGNQCWLKENMRCTTSPNGLLTQSTTSTSTAAYRNAYYYVPANNITLSGVEYTPEQFTRKYGIFYNFLAAVDTNVYAFTNDIYTHPRRGICPKGWHIPSEADWLVLEKEVLDGVSGLSEDSLGNNIRGTGGGRLTTSCDWVVALSSTNPGNYLYAERNSTNFSALPSGMFSNPGTGESAIFWTANQNAVNSGNAWVRRLMYGTKGSVRNSLARSEGASVRCVRDVPQVSAAADSVSCTSMTVSAKVTGLGTITGKTVCAYKNADFTGTSVCAAAADMRVSNDSIYATIKNLDCNTRYYVKITATDGANNTEITISDSTRDMSFENLTTCTVGSVRALGIGTDLSHEHGYNGSTTEIDSVYDHEGNAYAVVQIGNQCWLKENMRATTRPSGTNILQVPFSDKSLSSPRAYYYENDINNYYKYGCLYNFPAAMDIDDLSTSFPYPHRGICPEGWHVPSDADWTTLATNAGVGVNPTGTGAGKLAGGCDWRESPNATAPGNYSYSDRNATSFYALPAAGCRDGVFNSLTAYANFWSTLPEINNQAYYRDLSYEHQYMGRVVNPRSFAYSVRCMRDAESITLTLTITANPSSDTVHLCGKTSATVTYTANLEGGTAGSYSWSTSGGSATASTSNTYTVTYTAAGNYTVTCTAAGISATKQVPIASGGVPATLELCEDCPTGSIMVKNGNCTTVTWVNNADPTKTATTAGTKYTVLNQSAAIPAGVYTVTGTNEDGCTVTETATLCEYVSHPCTVTSLRAGTALADGKYANKEYGSGTQLDFVSDHEGNMYRVVEIGTGADKQCWLAENMRATTSPSTHSKILMNPMILSTSSKSAAWYKYDSTKYSIVGVLYNWCAAVDTFYNDGQASHPELANDPNHVSTVWPVTLPVGNRRGICPEGWHVPTSTEWVTLVTNACGADNKSAGKLAGSCLWYANSVDKAPGNYSYADRNVTGFAAIPAGHFGGGFGDITWYPFFWSTSLSGSGQVYCQTLDAGRNNVGADYYNLNNGHSVRCVRDN